MKKNYLFAVLTALLLITSLSVDWNIVNAANYNEQIGCKPSNEEKKYFDKNFYSEIEKRGIPKSIKLSDGRTLNINKNYAVNHCTVLYGNHNSIPSSIQEREGSVYSYLGYGLDKRYVQNVAFPHPRKVDKYVQRSPFISSPWSSTFVKNKIKELDLPAVKNKSYASTNTVDGRKLTRAQELNKAIDGFHLNYGNGSLGPRGYFTKSNVYLKKNLSGTNLNNYASVDFFPDEYSFGVFNLYYREGDITNSIDRISGSYPNAMWLARFAMPPKKLLFSEKEDLAVTTFKVNKTKPWEGENVTFSVIVKNEGEVDIKNPKVKVQYGTKSSVITFNETLKPGKVSKEQKVTIKSPNTPGKKTAEAIGNPDGKNPANDKVKSNDKKSLTLNVQEIKRDYYIDAIEVLGDSYFGANNNKFFEGDQVKFRYKIGFLSNKDDETAGSLKVKINSGSHTKTHTIPRNLKSGDTTGWYYSYNSYGLNFNAPAVSGKDFKETNHNITVEVNPDNNPKQSKLKTGKNKKATAAYVAVNKVYDISVDKIEKVTPKYPKSKEKTNVFVKVCNTGNQDLSGYNMELTYGGTNVTEKTNKNVSFGNLAKGAYNNIDVISKCETKEVKEMEMIDIEKATDKVPLEINVLPNLPAGAVENDTSDNKQTQDIEVRNPNASVFIRNTGENPGVITETSGVSVVIANKMFGPISSPCTGDCKDSSNTDAYIKITDVTDKDNPVVVKNKIDVSFTNLQSGENVVVNVGTHILDYLKSLDEGVYKYQVTEFKIEAKIPHYKGEVDYSGTENYKDNSVTGTVHYYPERAPASLVNCKLYTNPEYFNVINGDGIIKSCAGHYPNNPSTQIEEGMQAYHFVLYRFLPTPIPKYDAVRGFENVEEEDPNYFNQVFILDEDITELGEEDTFLYSNKVGDIWKERGRYLPTGAVFDFKIKESREDGSDGKTIASGTVTYEIPESCYQTKTLNLKDNPKCNEVMLFLPNSDVNKFEEPAEHKGTIKYPLNGKTKIPYLNPGQYEFSVDAKESYQYYYQTNEAVNSDYYWSDVKKD